MRLPLMITLGFEFPRVLVGILQHDGNADYWWVYGVEMGERVSEKYIGELYT